LGNIAMVHRMMDNPSYPSGRRQAVPVAIALGGEPSVLLADEPPGKLDSKNVMAVIEFFRDDSQRGATICMVTSGWRSNACAEPGVRRDSTQALSITAMTG